jgi:hypothetical protein
MNPNTPTLLRQLAAALINYPTFDLFDSAECIVGVGLRMDDNGEIRPLREGETGISLRKEDFADKFGISLEDARALWVGDLVDENGKHTEIVNCNHPCGKVAAQQAAELLETLAKKYEANGE